MHGAVQHPCHLLVHVIADVAGDPPKVEPSLNVCGPEAAVGPQETLEQVAFLVDHVQAIVPVRERAALLRVVCLTLEIQALCEDSVRLLLVVYVLGSPLNMASEGIPMSSSGSSCRALRPGKAMPRGRPR